MHPAGLVYAVLGAGGPIVLRTSLPLYTLNASSEDLLIKISKGIVYRQVRRKI